MRPSHGSMVWWRGKGSLEWRFGYCIYVQGHDLVRMGRWNGDTMGGAVVAASEIEWKEYRP